MRGTIVTTNGLDTQAALRASAVQAAVPGPAAVVQRPDGGGGPALLRRSWLRAGRPPRYDPGRNWRDLPPGDLVGHGLGFEQEIEPLYAQIKAACPAGADGVLIAGTGFRCVGILEALEQDLKRPVISANQASLWHCLRSAGVQTKVAGYGNLLRL